MKQSTLYLALLPLFFTSVIYAETTDTAVLYHRAAQGDISTPGGARRLAADQTAALRDSLTDKPAKNIILFIGDGMGDSEITAARNYAEGAGGYFKGIDALPLTGQYTHYALDKKTGLRDGFGCLGYRLEHGGRQCGGVNRSDRSVLHHESGTRSEITDAPGRNRLCRVVFSPPRTRLRVNVHKRMVQ